MKIVDKISINERKQLAQKVGGNNVKADIYPSRSLQVRQIDEN